MSVEQKPMFMIIEDPTVEWPVIVSMPADGGGFAEFQMNATIRVLPPKEYEDLIKKESEPPSGAETMIRPISEVLEGNYRIFSRLIMGWGNVLDGSRNQVAFSQEQLRKLTTGVHGIRFSDAVWRAISEVRTGAALKNSAPPLADGG